MESLTRYIEGKLKLKVNVMKSAVDRTWKSGRFWDTVLPEMAGRSWQIKPASGLKDKVKQLTRKGGRSLEQRQESLNRYLRGWKSYFREVETRSGFENLTAGSGDD